MCTLTVLRQPSGLLVTMSRDDAQTRAEAPPALLRAGQGYAYLAPKDLRAGGTWIGVNSASLAACLLNRYDDAPAGSVSRGAIVGEAMIENTAGRAAARLMSLNLADYSPFTCVLLSHEHGMRLDWTGSRLFQTPLENSRFIMLTSSSWRENEVRSYRQNLFAECLGRTNSDNEKLDSFHCERLPDKDAWAPMMHRPYAETKSIVQVEIGAADVSMKYWSRASALAARLHKADVALRLKRRLASAPQNAAA